MLSSNIQLYNSCEFLAYFEICYSNASHCFILVLVGYYTDMFKSMVETHRHR